METITITERDFRYLERKRVKRRSDCLASFSVNPNGEIWMCATRGWTKLERREYVDCPVIERIAEMYLSLRPQGGRIFLRRDGLFDREFGVRSDWRFANVQLPPRLAVVIEKTVYMPLPETDKEVLNGD